MPAPDHLWRPIAAARARFEELNQTEALRADLVPKKFRNEVQGELSATRAAMRSELLRRLDVARSEILAEIEELSRISDPGERLGALNKLRDETRQALLDSASVRENAAWALSEHHGIPLIEVHDLLSITRVRWHQIRKEHGSPPAFMDERAAWDVLYDTAIYAARWYAIYPDAIHAARDNAVYEMLGYRTTRIRVAELKPGNAIWLEGRTWIVQNVSPQPTTKSVTVNLRPSQGSYRQSRSEDFATNQWVRTGPSRAELAAELGVTGGRVSQIQSRWLDEQFREPVQADD